MHTPGPWETATSGNNNVHVLAPSARPDRREDLATFWNIGGSEDPAEANARLCAAAPELLAVAKQLVESRKCLGWTEGECDLWLGPIWHAAQDAIAKAQGA